MRRLSRWLPAAVLASLVVASVAVAGPYVPTTDPKYALQWYAQAPASPGAPGILGLPDAWGYSLGGPGVTVAVLGTGVMTNTPDLAGRLLPAVSATGTAPFSDATLAATLILHHETWMASVAAMGIDNGIGGAGMGNFSILPVTVTNSSGNNMSEWIAEGIRMAADAGARAITISHSTLTYSLLEGAAAYARDQGALVFVAAGNSNTRVDRFDYENLIFVSGTDQLDNRWDGGVAGGSTWGPFVDLAAPAADVVAADPTLSTGYGTGSGTSFSAPMAAGAAALLWSINPNLTPAQVKGILYGTAVDLGTPGWDEEFGWGRLDVGAAAVQAYALIPEPQTLGLMALGAGAMLARRRRLRHGVRRQRRSERRLTLTTCPS